MQDEVLKSPQDVFLRTLTDHPYQLPLGFDTGSYLHDALIVMHGRPITVELLFNKATAAWVKDRLWHPGQHLKDGRLRMTLRVADTPELVGWILSFGSGVQVVEPPELRQKVREAARKILRAAV
jgi:predicted DNA-binding transcriptional regulator YafY